MSNTDTNPIMQRVRHDFRARHVQLLAREQISPGFVRLTLGGPELQGFVSAGFDDHTKLILPQAGLDKPNLPQIIDGKPHIDGERPTMRDYTPLQYDAATNTLRMDFAVHGTGPAVEWAQSAPMGQWLGLAGPRGSLVIRADLDWHVLLGDETAVPAIERRLTELPAGSRAIVRVQLANPADQRAWSSASALDLQWVASLADAVDALELPPGEGFVWAAGENRAMAELRKRILAKPGANPKRMRVASYWKQGESGHHEELSASD
ncbi:siderophore-interacting protein [Comamonas testosteroni]|uniref:Siderophore-interacting protein n=1 Tax=Comamonas testosteroni TaxID=285 RepID=A0A373FPG5_COMTE|nr:siderophore-interacting protein [Comamonas testosteroni]